MRLFRVTKDYLKEIQKISLFIPQQEEVLGTVLRINGYIYFLPINNEDSSDYESDGTIKKSSPFVLRMTSSDNKKSLGKCMLSNMFPVPYNELLSFDFAVISENLISLFNKKIEYLKKNKSRIEKSAQRIYKQKIKGYKQPYLNRTVQLIFLRLKSFVQIMKWNIMASIIIVFQMMNTLLVILSLMELQNII